MVNNQNLVPTVHRKRQAYLQLLIPIHHFVLMTIFFGDEVGRSARYMTYARMLHILAANTNFNCQRKVKIKLMQLRHFDFDRVLLFEFYSFILPIVTEPTDGLSSNEDASKCNADSTI